MSWVPYSAYEPVHTTTTTSSALHVINPRCYGCRHSSILYGSYVCSCQSRIIKFGEYGKPDMCLSYVERGRQ